jgi:hypothetical protein
MVHIIRLKSKVQYYGLSGLYKWLSFCAWHHHALIANALTGLPKSLKPVRPNLAGRFMMQNLHSP